MCRSESTKKDRAATVEVVGLGHPPRFGTMLQYCVHDKGLKTVRIACTIHLSANGELEHNVLKNNSCIPRIKKRTDISTEGRGMGLRRHKRV